MPYPEGDMYQRMLNKQITPTMAEMTSCCGETGELFSQLNKWLSETFSTEHKIVFPYGNHYGWGIAHRKKNKLICNIFAEDNAFTVMLRLSNEQWKAVYDNAQDYMREHIDKMYPCGEGGWVHYRVTGKEHVDDIMTALTLRCT